MVLQAEVDFKALVDLGRDYPWKRPAGCPGCHGRLWGHGWVTIYLEGAPGQVWIRRFLCPECNGVVRLRPKGFWPRFYYGIETIRSALEDRWTRKRWPAGMARQVGGHWLRGLIRHVKMRLGFEMEVFPQGYEGLISLGWVPVSRSIAGVRVPQSG